MPADLSAARKNSKIECGLPVGRLGLKIKETGDVQFILIPCTQEAGHRDQCQFIGADLIIRRRPDTL